MEREPGSGLALELIQMAEDDQAVRQPEMPLQEVFNNTVDAANTGRLQQIVAENGWPTISKVGAEASHAAWLVVQHSPSLAFMKDCLERMRAAGEDVNPANIAYLEDRVRIIEGRPQLYGTQFQGEHESFEAFPIEDPNKVDQRRASVGLSSFADNMRELRAYYQI